MGIFNFFGEQEHKVFDYKPIYFDKEKEERKAERERKKREKIERDKKAREEAKRKKEEREAEEKKEG